MDGQTAREELAAIRVLMTESQSFLSGTWSHQLVWGCLGTIGLSATWLAVRAERYPIAGGVWIAALAIGWTYSLVVASRHRRGARVHNVATRAFGGIWLALGVTLTLLGGVTIVSRAVDPSGLPGLIAIVFGAGYFASGFLAELRWLAGVGVAWWAGGVALLLWRAPEAILVLAVMTVLLEVGPALALRHRERGRRVGG